MAEGQSTALQTRGIASGTLPTVLRVELITPRGVVAHDDSDALTAPGEGGEFELLPGHVPMMTALKPGVLTIGERKRVRYAVSSGYLRIDPANVVEVLVEQAVLGSEVDVEAARADLKAAEAEVAKWGDRELDGDYKNAVERVEWARARLDAATAPN
jgi:F-type H+-transporting ATPase subunit epsilon